MNKGTLARLITIFIILIFAAAIIGGCMLYINLFPMADPIRIPTTDEIASIELGPNSDLTVKVADEDYNQILVCITSAQPTRIMSVNDAPSVRSYYRISILTYVREYRYYLYADNGLVYIEDPYTGIYKTDQRFLDYISAYTLSEPE